MEMLGWWSSNFWPILMHIGVEARCVNSSSALMSFNASSINNKAKMLHDYIASQNVDLSCLTKTWVREGKTVLLQEFSLPPTSRIL